MNLDTEFKLKSKLLLKLFYIIYKFKKKTHLPGIKLKTIACISSIHNTEDLK